MSVFKSKGRWRFSFNRIINGQRVRATKLLPQGWSAQQADDFDKKESAKIYSEFALGVTEAPLIDQAVLLYIQNRCPHLKYGEGVIKQLQRDHEHYTGKLLTQLNDVAMLIRKDNVSEATKRNRISYIRAACRYAYKHHNLGDADPAARLTMPKVNNQRHVYIDRKDMLKICKVADKRVRPYIRMAFYSGMRMGEIFKAKIQDDCFYLGTTKNGQPRLIPIHAKIASAANKYLPARIGTWTLHKYYTRAKKLTGYDNVRFHDLRHSTASAMINSGVDLYTVGAVLGHKDPTSTKRYAHLSTSSLAAAIRKIG